MVKKKNEQSNRKRSRPIQKQKVKTKLKRNKPAMFLAFFVVFLLVAGSLYAATQFLGGDSESNYKNDPDYINALENTNYPVAVLETSKGAIAVELYDDKAPVTCQNFINLVNDGFYDGMIFQRIMDDFMIQTGSTMPDGTTKESPYGQISTFEGDLTHVDGAISMASGGPGTPGEAQFFIMDGARVGPEYPMDGNYATFGKTIYGIEVVRDIADDNHDGRYEPSPGGGKPYNDIIIERIYMAKE